MSLALIAFLVLIAAFAWGRWRTTTWSGAWLARSSAASSIGLYSTTLVGSILSLALAVLVDGALLLLERRLTPWATLRSGGADNRADTRPELAA